MSTLSRRGPNANAPAKLPALETSRIADRNTQQAIDALREWIEVRLGSRGDRFERAVTFRDLDPLTGRVTALEDTSVSMTATLGNTASSPDLTALQNRVTTLEAYAPAKDAELAGLISGLRTDLQFLDAQQQATQAQLALFADEVIARILARQNEFTAAQTTQQQFVPLDEDDTLGFLAFPDGAVSTTFLIEATSDLTLFPPSAPKDGATYTFTILQDSIGGHVVSLATDFLEGDTVVVDTAPDSYTVFTAVAVYDVDDDQMYFKVGQAGSGTGGVLPVVTGEVPPVLVYLDDGSLVYSGI